MISTSLHHQRSCHICCRTNQRIMTKAVDSGKSGMLLEGLTVLNKLPLLVQVLLNEAVPSLVQCSWTKVPSWRREVGGGGAVGVGWEWSAIRTSEDK